jgi:hypothetical protein
VGQDSGVVATADHFRQGSSMHWHVHACHVVRFYAAALCIQQLVGGRSGMPVFSLLTCGLRLLCRLMTSCAVIRPGLLAQPQPGRQVTKRTDRQGWSKRCCKLRHLCSWQNILVVTFGHQCCSRGSHVFFCVDDCH